LHRHEIRLAEMQDLLGQPGVQVGLAEAEACLDLGGATKGRVGLSEGCLQVNREFKGFISKTWNPTSSSSPPFECRIGG
jgi:hypothetical protein